MLLLVNHTLVQIGLFKLFNCLSWHFSTERLTQESRMTSVECSTKAGWLSLSALRKQDGCRWVLYESRMAFVECSTKAGWLSFRALQKPFKKCVNRDSTKFRSKIAYVGGPSFPRRPWPFGERRSRVRATSATLGVGATATSATSFIAQKSWKRRLEHQTLNFEQCWLRCCIFTEE